MDFPIAPEQASNFAREYDALFYLITGLTVVFSLMVLVMCVYAVVKYRRGRPADRKNPTTHNLYIEGGWSAVSLGLGLFVFAWGAKIFIEMREVPDDAMEIFVIGKRWMWHVQHTNGVRENNELHVPVGQPVKLTIISQDVVHGFYIPQFRVQYHAVPGRYTSMWFTATKAGRYNLWCTIHCGTQHSEMGGYVYAMEPSEFSKWLKWGGNRFKPVPVTMADAGKRLWEEQNCASCHGTVDSKRAPSLNGVVGAKRVMNDGTIVTADRAYLRESILYPEARLRKGYLAAMPNYSGQLTEEQVNQLIEYIRTMGLAPSAAPVANTGAPAPNSMAQTGGAR